MALTPQPTDTVPMITMTPSSASGITNGQVVYDTGQDAMTANINGLNQALVGCIFTSNTSKTITNTTSVTSAVPAGQGTLTLPANFWAVGKTIRLRGGGVFSTAAVTPGSFTVKVNHGATNLVSQTVSSILANLSSAGFTFETMITCASIGSSGTFYINGGFSYSTGLNLSRNFVDLTNSGATITVNTTTSNLLDVTGTWGTASTSNILTTTNVIAEVFN